MLAAVSGPASLEDCHSCFCFSWALWLHHPNVRHAAHFYAFIPRVVFSFTCRSGEGGTELQLAGSHWRRTSWQGTETPCIITTLTTEAFQVKSEHHYLTGFLQSSLVIVLFWKSSPFIQIHFLFLSGGGREEFEIMKVLFLIWSVKCLFSVF